MEDKSQTWLIVYGAMIAAQWTDHCHFHGPAIDEKDIKRFMEEAACIADMEEEARKDGC